MKSYRFVFVCFFAGLSCLLGAQVHFVQNRGQWKEEIKFRADVRGGKFIIGNGYLLYTLLQPQEHLHPHIGKEEDDFVLKGHNIRIDFLNANLSAETEGGDKAGTYHNYFIGNDPSKWASGVPLYGNLTVKDLYPGIDLEIMGFEAGNIKYNLVLHPGADLAQVKMKYSGAESVVLKDNELTINNTVIPLKENTPLSYYSDVTGKVLEEVKIKYILAGDVVSFKAPRGYDNQRTLVIDPVVVFSTYSGSYADNWGYTATYDPEGNAYSGGTVFGSDGLPFPTTPGAFQQNYAGGFNDKAARDIGILKYTPDGSKLIYATYLGGELNEQPHSMVVDAKGDLIILGSTFSDNFPRSKTGFSTTLKGNSDIFLVKLSADGKELRAMTFIGGSKRDGLNGFRASASQPVTGPLAFNYGDEFRGEVITDKNNYIYFVSSTASAQSDGFPVKNSFNTNFGGVQDGCVFKISSDMNSVLWGAYIGGDRWETCNGITLDEDGNVFICGGTTSSSLNLAVNGHTGTYIGGSADGFVVKLDNIGKNILGATYIGTAAYDQAYFVQVDKYGLPYVAGQSAGEFPISSSKVFSESQGGQFIAKYSRDLKKVEFSSRFGMGNVKPQISPSAFMVDSCERIFFSGWGGSSNTDYNSFTGDTRSMTVSDDAFQKHTDGSDFYLTVFTKNMSGRLYASFFGGGSGSNPLNEHVDGGTSRFDKKGVVYQAVCGGCGGAATPDFPTSGAAYSKKNNSLNCNNAIFKVDFENLNRPPEVLDEFHTVIAGNTFTLDYICDDQDTYDSLFAFFSGEPIDGITFPKPHVILQKSQKGFPPLSNGLSWTPGCDHVGDTIEIRVLARDQGCPDIKEDTAVIKIAVLPPPAPLPPGVVCMTFINKDELELNLKETDQSNYLDYYLILRKTGTGNWEIADTIFRNQALNFHDTKAFENTTIDYCYTVVGVNICGKFGDSSYTICGLEQRASPIHSVNIFTTTVVENKDVLTNWYMSQEPDFSHYEIFRSKNKGGKYEFVPYVTITSKKDTFFIDTKADVHKTSYCYQLTVNDKCSNTGDRSNIGCNIVLQGESKPFSHQLHWNPYMQWNNGVSTYELSRKDDRQTRSLIKNGNGSFLETTDENLDYDWGGYWYRVMAYENDGAGATSMSNEIYLVQEPLLHVPTAFTKNGDNLNETWGIVDVFVKDYHMEVFNRWGQKILETKNKNFDWDGFFKGTEPWDNVFIWMVSYSGWDGSRHYQKGTLTILR